MKSRRSTLMAVTALACTAVLTLAGCGGGSSSSIAKFCKDDKTLSEHFNAIGDIDVIDPATLSTLKQLTNGLRVLAGESPAAVKADVQTLVDDMGKVDNGEGDSIDDDAFQAAGDRVDAFARSKCTAAGTAKDAAAPKTKTTTTSKDATVVPGLVVDQDPAAGIDVAADDTVTLTVSALPDQAYLSDFRASDGQFRTGVASMKGVPYTHGVLQSQSAGSSPQKTTFTLSSHYTRLRGVVGLDDSFTGGASVQVEIFDQDNTSLFKKTVKVGQPATIDIPVTGVIQLTLEATDLLSNVSNGGTVVWGDLQVISGS